jgi:hypothetical protein
MHGGCGAGVRVRAQARNWPYLDAAEPRVSDERGLHPGARRRDVHRLAEPDHGHDVAVEVPLPEQPPRRAHRLSRLLRVPPYFLCLRPGHVPSSSRRRHVYWGDQQPLPERGVGGGGGTSGIGRRGRIHRRTRPRAAADCGDDNDGGDCLGGSRVQLLVEACDDWCEQAGQFYMQGTRGEEPVVCVVRRVSGSESTAAGRGNAACVIDPSPPPIGQSKVLTGGLIFYVYFDYLFY